MTTTDTKKTARTRRAAVPEVTVEHGTSVVDALAETPAAVSPQFLLVAPADLTVAEDTNIRKDLHLGEGAEFVESIRELGVLQPVVAYPDPMYDGKYRVELGHRRAVAAQMVNADAVPTFIVPSPADADRVAGQLAENIHRAQMSESEQVAAVQQLALFGMPADQIAKKTARPRTVIDAALAVAKSATAVEILDAQPEITLVQAAQLLEFEDDPDTYAELVDDVTNEPDQIDHIIQSARSARELTAGRAARRAELEAEGIHVFADDESFTGWTRRYGISIGRKYGPAPTEEELRAALLPDRAGDLGATPNHSWENEGEPRKVRVDWYVRTEVASTIDGWVLDSAGQKKTKTDAEKEQARKDRTDKQLWLDATTVRRAFIRDLVTRPKPPKGWELIVAQYLAGALEGLDEYGREVLIHEWLDINLAGSTHRTIRTKSVWYHSTEIWLEQHPNRAPQLALATALAGFEKHLEKIDAYQKPWRLEKPNVGPYLAFLIDAGYVPAQIENDVHDADLKTIRAMKTATA